MFNIDEYLDDIRLKDVTVDEELLRRTKRRCEETEEKKRRHSLSAKRWKRTLMIALPTAAVLTVGIFIGARFFGHPANPSGAVAYYTVDINPSVCVNVGPEGVTGVVAQNEDAIALVGALDCVGKPADEAIRQIISSAQAAGYFAEGERYVLIGCFTSDGTVAQTALGGLQAQLEADFGDMVDLLIVSGTLEDKQMADALGVSPGLLKLSQLAEGVQVTDGDKVEDVIGEVTEVNRANYASPALKVTGDGQYVKLAWNKQDFDAMGFTGKVKYHFVAADTAVEVTEFSARAIKTIPFYTYGDQPTSLKLTLAECGLAPGESQYFGVWAEYCGVMVAGSPVLYTAPAAEATATPLASTISEPTQTVTPSAGHTVSGRVSGDNVLLTWDKDTTKDFSGYKVVASRTNSAPSYPADGYLKYITNRDTTSISLYEGYGGLQGGVTYYFSITYLYQDGSTIAGNAVRLKVPEKDETEELPSPTPSASSSSYTASSISGYLGDDGKIYLSWTKISRTEYPGFEGYKVMYSFCDDTPVYGECGCDYVFWIEDDATISCSFAPSKIGACGGETVYFSITALYDGHSVKKAGNTKVLVMPGGCAEPEPYVSTTISGSLGEDGKIHLSWEAVSHCDFCYYKVVYSFTDSTPVYGEGAELYTYYDDPSRTSCTVDPADIGLDPGETVYFSITVVYCGDTKKAGNAAAITMSAE